MLDKHIISKWTNDQRVSGNEKLKFLLLSLHSSHNGNSNLGGQFVKLFYRLLLAVVKEGQLSLWTNKKANKNTKDTFSYLWLAHYNVKCHHINISTIMTMKVSLYRLETYLLQKILLSHCFYLCGFKALLLHMLYLICFLFL